MPDDALNSLDVTVYDLLLPEGTISDACALVAGGFGEGPFGERDWLYEVAWHKLTTERMRTNDPINNCEFRRFWYGLLSPLNRLRRQARDFHEFLLALTSRSRHDGFDVVVSEASQSTDATIVTLAMDSNLQASPALLTPVGVDWYFRDATGLRFKIIAVRKSNQQDTEREATGTVFGLLVEIDIEGTLGDVDYGTGSAVEPSDIVTTIAKSYGIDLPDGLDGPRQKGLVANAVPLMQIKGTADGINAFGRQRAYSVQSIALSYVDSDYVDLFDPSDVTTGSFRWSGFCVALGDGVFTAIDSSEDLDTLLGVEDTSRTYAAVHRTLGEGVIGVGVEAPASDGLTGTVHVIYQIADGATVKAFVAIDKRTSSTRGDLIPFSEDYRDALPLAKVGVIHYDTGKIQMVGLDQSVLTTITERPFAKDTRISFRFGHLRQYSLIEPRVARFDDVKADMIYVDEWLYPGTNDAEYEFALTPTVLTLATSPYSAASLHTVRVTYTSGASPIPVSGPAEVPSGIWKLVSPTEEWWVEKVTAVDADEDDLVVAGTVPPDLTITKLVHVPQNGSVPGYCSCASLKIDLTQIGSGSDYYSDPDGNEATRAANAIKASVIPAHVTVVEVD